MPPTRPGDRSDTDIPSTAALVGRALRLACPLCGHRPIFRRWFSMDERCRRCGLRFERVVGQWFGSLALNTTVSFGVLLAVVLGSFLLAWPEAPSVVAVVVGVAVALVLPVAFFPWSRTLWLAFDLRIRPLEVDEAPDRSALSSPEPDTES